MNLNDFDVTDYLTRLGYKLDAEEILDKNFTIRIDGSQLGANTEKVLFDPKLFDFKKLPPIEIDGTTYNRFVPYQSYGANITILVDSNMSLMPTNAANEIINLSSDTINLGKDGDLIVLSDLKTVFASIQDSQLQIELLSVDGDRDFIPYKLNIPASVLSSNNLTTDPNFDMLNLGNRNFVVAVNTSAGFQFEIFNSNGKAYLPEPKLISDIGGSSETISLISSSYRYSVSPSEQSKNTSPSFV